MLTSVSWVRKKGGKGVLDVGRRKKDRKQAQRERKDKLPEKEHKWTLVSQSRKR